MRLHIPFLSRRIRRLLLVACVIAPVCCFIIWEADDLFGHDIPLYSAAQRGNWEQAQALLARGADPNETTDFQNDRTALFWAAYYGRVDMVQLLLRKGCKVNHVDTHGQTALDYAGSSRAGNPSAVIRLLQQAGAKRGKNL